MTPLLLLLQKLCLCDQNHCQVIQPLARLTEPKQNPIKNLTEVFCVSLHICTNILQGESILKKSLLRT